MATGCVEVRSARPRVVLKTDIRGEEIHLSCRKGIYCQLENVSKNPAHTVRVREVFFSSFGESTEVMYKLQPGEKQRMKSSYANAIYVYSMDGGLLDFMKVAL